MHEHWDMEGGLNGKILKFDVKGMKRKNRNDKEKQDEWAWVEGTNVRGNPGWVKGRADYIVFERSEYWLMVNREELLNFVLVYKWQVYNQSTQALAHYLNSHW